MSDGRAHRLRVESQTWANTPPFPPSTLYRSYCSCGWRGEWFVYRENARARCPVSVRRIACDLGEVCDWIGALRPVGLTHGRHCSCSSCAREDWTNPKLAPCGMHGWDCPPVYMPIVARRSA